MQWMIPIAFGVEPSASTIFPSVDPAAQFIISNSSAVMTFGSAP